MPNSFIDNCYQCKKIVTCKQNCTVCSLCSVIYHQKCFENKLSSKNMSLSKNYTCQTCAAEVFPFHSLSNKEIIKELSPNFEMNASLLNEIFSGSEHINNTDGDFSNDDEIGTNIMKDVYITAEESKKKILVN